MLGDRIESALEAVGITKEEFEAWLGVPCNCEERKEKLNAIDHWARRVVANKMEKAKHYYDQITKER